jgi:hypothetical protein
MDAVLEGRPVNAISPKELGQRIHFNVQRCPEIKSRRMKSKIFLMSFYPMAVYRNWQLLYLVPDSREQVEGF